MFVKEELSFERGTNPKKVMGVGFKQEIEKIISRLADIYDEGYEKVMNYPSDSVAGYGYAMQEISEEIQDLLYYRTDFSA
jgi:hypothetical protein